MTIMYSITLYYLASSEPDTIYFDQVTKQHDCKEFLNAVIREVNSHCQQKHWKLFLREEVPKGKPILDSIWEMKRKGDIFTRKANKWKSRSNIHGVQQEYGVNHLDTYSPVVTCFSIRTLMILSAINKCNSIQVDFVQD